MATVKQVVGTRTSLAYSGTALSTLASATYVENTTAYNCATNGPLDVLVEVNATPGSTPSGNSQVLVFAAISLDNTNFTSGPTSGTTTTDEPNLYLLGALPVSTSGVAERGIFSLLKSLGFLPDAFYIIIKNDCGVALSAGTVYTAEISETVA